MPLTHLILKVGPLFQYRVASVEFFDDVWGTIYHWDCGPTIDDVMETEARWLEEALEQRKGSPP